MNEEQTGKQINPLFDYTIDILHKNLVNSLMYLHFHEKSTDEEMTEYYGGPQNREAHVEDIVKKIKQDQIFLKFFINNLNKLKDKYETKFTTGDLNLPVQPTTGVSNIEGGTDSSTETITGIESNGNEDRSADLQTESDNSGGNVREESGENGDGQNVA